MYESINFKTTMMARMLRNLGEYVSGRIGNVVFVRTKSKSYVRKAPNCENTVWSDQQLLYRNRIKQVAALWRSVKSENISEIWKLAGTQNPHQGMNGFAWFVKLNIPAFNIDGSLIDPTLILVADGKLVSAQKMELEQHMDDRSRVYVNWENDRNLKPARLGDLLLAVTYLEGKFSDVFHTGLLRGDLDGEIFLPKPVPLSDPSNVYFFWASEDQEFSKSVSFALN